MYAAYSTTVLQKCKKKCNLTILEVSYDTNFIFKMTLLLENRSFRQKTAQSYPMLFLLAYSCKLSINAKLTSFLNIYYEIFKKLAHQIGTLSILFMQKQLIRKLYDLFIQPHAFEACIVNHSRNLIIKEVLTLAIE